MNFKKALAIGLTTVGLSMSAQASDINVGGVIWDPESTNAFPNEIDFTSSGIITETVVSGVGGTVDGWGYFTNINSTFPNVASFCPGCELTLTFSMELVTLTPTGGNNFDFEFDNLVIDIFVDHTPDFDNTPGNAGDGNLWLRLTNNGLITGDGTDIATGSDKGDGEGNLDVVQGMGLAWTNFDTNTRLNGSDFVFTSSFQPIDPNNPQLGLLTGDFQLTGNSIPEPASIALLGLGMLGFAAARKRKV